MSEYSDEEQVKRLKEWWAQNGTALIIGASIGLAAIFGWRYYGEHTRSVAENASASYEQMTSALASDDLDTATRTKNTLQADFGGTPYAGLASLQLAKAQFDAGEFTPAAENLSWVMEHAADPVHKHVARLRLARVRWAQGDIAAAKTVLNAAAAPAGFEAIYLELEGDLHRSEGHAESARASYEQALENNPGTRQGVLNAKLAQVSAPDSEKVVAFSAPAPAATSDDADAEELAQDDAASSESE